MTTVILCDCGIAFQGTLSPSHVHSPRHQRAMKVTICPACFYGDCTGCIVRRGSWRCRCSHEYGVGATFPGELDAELFATWQDWLQAGCPPYGV